MTPAKVLVCHNHYAQPGGESTAFENLVRGLRESGHQVTTYVRSNADIGQMSLPERASIVARSFGSRRTDRELTRLVETNAPEVAVVQNVFPLLSPSVYTTLERLRVPIIQATYNYRFVCPAAELYSRGEICERCVKGSHLNCVARRCYRDSVALSAWYAWLIGKHRRAGTFARAIDVFHVPDQFMADKLVEGGLPKEKMVKNVNPFFVSDYSASTVHQGYIAFVGRLVRHKGVLTLLKALRLTSTASVQLIGDGEMRAELGDFVRSNGLESRVKFRGPLWGNDLVSAIAGACAVAVPSEWYDNLPLVLCQANALGKPVLASRINGIPEYVEEGVNGFLFTPGNAEELEALIDRVASLTFDEYGALAARARQFAERRLDFGEYYRVFSETVDRVRRR